MLLLMTGKIMLNSAVAAAGESAFACLELQAAQKPGFHNYWQVEISQGLRFQLQVFKDDIALEDRDLQRVRIDAIHICSEVFVQVEGQLGFEHSATLLSMQESWP